ncbi:hypothetical protein ACFL0H_00220 [Thermodesulfobacteriota bacterium]
MHRGLQITRAATIDRLKGVNDSKDSGPLRLIFQDGTYVTISSEHAEKSLAALADLFGATLGKGDLQEKIYGQRIVYCMTERQILCGFTPYAQWEGPEMVDRDFLIDKGSACCGGWGPESAQIAPHIETETDEISPHIQTESDDISPHIQLELFEENYFPTYEFDIEPGGHLPKKPPRTALLLCAVDWSWSPMHDRLDYYYVSRTRNRKYWILWKEYPDEWDKPAYRIYCTSSGAFRSHYEAGKEMLKRSWSWDKEENLLDHFHGIIEGGALNMDGIEEIGEQVWGITKTYQ